MLKCFGFFSLFSFILTGGSSDGSNVILFFFLFVFAPDWRLSRLLKSLGFFFLLLFAPEWRLFRLLFHVFFSFCT